MKKSIKLVSVALASLMAASAFSITASALPRPTKEECEAVGEQKIYFEFPDGTWGDWSNLKINKLNNTLPVYCNPYAVYGNEKEFFDPGWETKPGQCTYTGEGKTVFYDINSEMSINHYSEVDDKGKKVKLYYYRYMETEPGKDYGVLFSTTANGGFQTADVNMTADCLGDTVVLDDPIQTRENAANSAKSDYFAHWKNHSDLVTKANVLSTGKFVDGQFPQNQPKAQMLSNALKEYLTNFINVGFFQLESNQKIMEKLGVTPQEVYDQYMKDNADIINGGTVEPANPDKTDVDNGCPVDFIRYDKVKLNMDIEHKKLASPKEVRKVLGLPEEEPTTAAPTTEEPTEAPTTEAPTTVAPTTEAPTTVEPTTEAPTTEAPTTEPKPAEDVFVLAGSSNFVSTGWSPDPDSYKMTKGEDGVYSVVVPEVAAEEGALYQVKVVQFVGGDPANAVWHGMDNTDLNYDFMLSQDCDVTVTYNPATGEINVTGDGVVPPVYNISKITAVGAGQGNFLNGIVWDPDAADNQMTEVKPGVYEITFEDCDTNTDYQFKFAANGGWDMNWGLVKETEAKLNEPNPAQYNSDNILFNVESEEETVDVTLQLDISNWDTVKKGGATYTITISKEEPTTEAPTTVEPTTEAPTTEAPTTEPVAEDVFVLAGSSNFVSNGWSPDPDTNVMTKGEDGVYTAVVPNVESAVGALYQVKVVQFVGGDPANAVWHGMDNTDLNYDFMLSQDCDVTVTYNPATGEINVTGDGVVPPVYNISKITAVGAGQGNFLNGIVWDPDAADNQMTEVKPGVYEITFEDCDTNTDYQFKFAANGGWDMNWGLVKETEAKLNEPNPAQYNSDNILFNVESEEETVDVTLQLDISNWDTVKKGGATYTIFINRETPVLWGDVDGDGVITTNDATYVQKYSIDLPTTDNFNAAVADVNADGRISVLDATCIQKFVAEFKNGTGRTGQPVVFE